jgi:O-antigen ligase
MTSSSVTDAPVPAGRVGAAVAVLGAASVISVTFSVAVSSIAMGASFLLLALVVARSRAWPVPATGLERAFLFYVAAEVVSSLFSVDRADSFTNMKRVLLIGVVYVSAFSFRSERRTTMILAALAVLGALTAAAEIASLRMAGGVVERPTMFQMAMTEGGIRMLIALLVLPFVVSRALPARTRLLFAAALVPILAGLVVSQTRSAWAGFAAGSLVMGVAWDRRMLAALAVLAVLFALFAPAEIRNRALSVVELHQGGTAAPDSVTTDAESNSSRIQMITTGWRMFLDRPVFGWGDIGLRPYYETYVTPLTLGEGGHLHNNLMESLVTLGVPGFVAVVWLFWRMFAVIRRSGRGAPRDSYRSALGAGILAAYAGFHVLGLFEYNFGDHEVMVLVWFMTGLAAAATPGAEVTGTQA